MTWIVEFYVEEDGHAPVEELLSNLSKEHRAKAMAIVQRLKEAGPTLAFPYSSQVRGKLRELRTQYGKNKIRILYFADKQRRFILLHAFIKRTEKTSEHDIRTAEQRMNKHDEETRNPAGQKFKARGARRPQMLIELLENPQHGFSSDKKWVWIGGQMGELEFEFFHEVEGGNRMKATPKFVIIGGQFGEALFECRLVEKPSTLPAWVMKGRIDCGTLELTFYAEPESGGVSPGPEVHECERTEDGCIKKVFLKEFLGIEKLLRLM